MAHAGTITLTFTGVNADWRNDGQYYTDPYRGQIGSEVIDIWCVDFAHESTYVSSWTANVTSTTGSSFVNTYLYARDPAHVRTDYLEILWLINNYQNPPLGYETLPPTQYSLEVQYAIWSFSGDAHSSDDGLRTLALDAVNGGYNPAGWSILTDINGEGTITNGHQEFIVHYTVPEPSLVLLILVGLSAVCIFCYHAGCR
jgi:hypothetical protein